MLLILALAVVHMIHPDIYPAMHVIGVSVGTNNHYWSFEITWHYLSVSLSSSFTNAQ